MASETQTNIISVQIDESAKNKLVKGLQEVRVAQRNVASENAALAKSAANSAQDIRAATSAIAEYENRLKQVQASGTDLSGDIASSFGGIRGALGSFGAGGASPALDILEGFADIGEFAPRLKVQLTSVGDALRASAGASGELVTKAGDAVGGLLGVSGSLGSIIAVAAPVAATLATLALVTANYNQQAQAQVTQLEAVLNAQQRVAEAVASGTTTEQAEAELTRLERLRAEQDRILNENVELYARALQEIGASTGGLGFIFAGLDPRIQSLSGTIAENRTALAETEASIASTTNALEDSRFAANDTRVAEAELARTREQESQRAIQIAEQNAARIAQLEQQRVDLANNRAIQQVNAEASAALEARFTREDELAESIDHANNLVEIANAGNAKIEAIQAELAALPAEQSKALAEIQAKGNGQVQKLNSEYFASQIKATRNFAKEQGRIASDTAKTAKRLAEDIEKSLRDAVRDNDVVAFLKAQEEGNTQLKRNAEDASEEERRRTEDFIAAQEEERQAFQQKQAEILANISEERAKSREAFSERRQALEQQIKQEQAATQQALADAQARYEQEEALEQQAAQRDAQRLALRQQQEDAAFQRQVANINRQIAGIGQVEGAFVSSVARIQSAINSLRAGGNSSSGGSYKSPYSKSGTFGAGGFASGQGGSKSVTVNINNTVGDIATGSQVTEAVNNAKSQIYSTVASAFIASS